MWDDILKQPSSYPLCKVPGHFHNDLTSTPISRTVRHNTTAQVPPAALSSPTSVSLHAMERPTDAPSLDNSHPAQMSIEDLCSPVISADLATTNGMQDIDTTGITTPFPTPETSTSTPLSSSPPYAIALQYNTDQLTSPDPPNLPSLASLNPVLDAMFPTGSSLSSHSPITQPNSSSSFPESRRSIIISITPSASPGMSFAPDQDAPTAPAHCSIEERDAFDCPSVNRSNTTVTPNFSLQSSLPLSTVNSDVAIVSPS